MFSETKFETNNNLQMEEFQENPRKKKNCRVIEVTNMVIGINHPQFIDIDYFHLKFDRTNKKIEIVGFEGLCFRENGRNENQTEFRHFQNKQPHQKYLIKKENIRKVELDPNGGIVIIQFKQALMSKYLQKEWKPKQIINNSKITLNIIQINPTKEVDDMQSLLEGNN